MNNSIMQTLLRGVASYQNLLGETPSVRVLEKIARHKGVKLSQMTVHNYLVKMEKRGWIVRNEVPLGDLDRRIPRAPRAIEITENGWKVLAMLSEKAG